MKVREINLGEYEGPKGKRVHILNISKEIKNILIKASQENKENMRVKGDAEMKKNVEGETKNLKIESVKVDGDKKRVGGGLSYKSKPFIPRRQEASREGYGIGCRLPPISLGDVGVQSTNTPSTTYRSISTKTSSPKPVALMDTVPPKREDSESPMSTPLLLHPHFISPLPPIPILFPGIWDQPNQLNPPIIYHPMDTMSAMNNMNNMNNMSTMSAMNNMNNMNNMSTMSTMNNMSTMNTMNTMDNNIDPTKNQSPEENYKTEMCKNWVRYAHCSYGEKCRFAHGDTDLIDKHVYNQKYKSKRCEGFHLRGSCVYGFRCNFIHQEPLPIREYKQVHYTALTGIKDYILLSNVIDIIHEVLKGSSRDDSPGESFYMKTMGNILEQGLSSTPRLSVLKNMARGEYEHREYEHREYEHREYEHREYEYYNKNHPYIISFRTIFLHLERSYIYKTPSWHTPHTQDTSLNNLVRDLSLCLLGLHPVLLPLTPLPSHAHHLSSLLHLLHTLYLNLAGEELQLQEIGDGEDGLLDLCSCRGGGTLGEGSLGSQGSDIDIEMGKNAFKTPLSIFCV